MASHLGETLWLNPCLAEEFGFDTLQMGWKRLKANGLRLDEIE